MHQTVIDLIITSDIAFKSTAKRNNSRTISRHSSCDSYTRNPLSGKHNIQIQVLEHQYSVGTCYDGRSFSGKFGNNQTTTALGAEQRSWQYHRYSVRDHRVNVTNGTVTLQNLQMQLRRLKKYQHHYLRFLRSTITRFIHSNHFLLFLLSSRISIY